jgi:hypothetical protein
MKVVEDGDKMEVTNSLILLEDNALHRNLDFVTFISKYSASLFLSLRQHEFDIFTIFFCLYHVLQLNLSLSRGNKLFLSFYSCMTKKNENVNFRSDAS